MTRPSLEAFVAVIKTTLGDAVFREDATTIGLERRVAELTGYENAALVPTGTMANQLALRVLLDCAPPYSILCDRRSHIYEFEAGGMSLLGGALVQAVTPSNGLYMTLNDIEKEALVEYDVHRARTKVISLENTALGAIVPSSEIQRICSWAHRNGIKVHLDGARLWEAVAAEGCKLKDYIGFVDTLAVDFSKGLGAPMGAAVVSSAENIKMVRNLGKAIGGGLRGAGMIASIAMWAIDSEFDLNGAVKANKVKFSHQKAKRIARMWTQRGGRLKRPCETNMIWVDLDDAGIEVSRWNELGRIEGVRLNGQRIVTHWQISEEAIEKLGTVFNWVLKANNLQKAKL